MRSRITRERVAVVAGTVSLTTARTIVLLQPSGHKLLKSYKKLAMHFEQTLDSDTVSTYQVWAVTALLC